MQLNARNVLAIKQLFCWLMSIEIPKRNGRLGLEGTGSKAYPGPINASDAVYPCAKLRSPTGPSCTFANSPAIGRP
jgi:hypothetical protein